MTRVRNVGWLTVEQLVRLLIGFFVTVLVARHLGPADFGVFVYVFGLVRIFGPLAVFGLEIIVMQRVASRPELFAYTVGSALLLRTLAAIFAAAATVAIVALFGGPAGITIQMSVLAAVTLLVQPSDTFNAYFKARENMARVVIPRILVISVLAAVSVWLVLHGAGLTAFVAVRAVEAVLLALAAVVVYLHSSEIGSAFKSSREEFIFLFRSGAPLMFSGVATALYVRVDQVMLGQLGSAQELGLYGVAVRVAEVANFLPVALQAGFYASLVRAHAETPDHFEHQIRHYFDVMSVGAWVMMAAIGLGSFFLFAVTFGPAYVAALPILAVLLAGQPFYFFALGLGTYLTLRSWLWWAPFVTGAAGVINIVLNTILIPEYGAMGAAGATVVSFFMASIGVALMIPRLRPVAFLILASLNPFGAAARLLRVGMRHQS